MIFTGERMIPEHNAGSQLYRDHVDRYRLACQYVRDQTVLDVACGSGYGSQMMAEAGGTVTGLDASREAVRYAEQNFPHPRATFMVGDAQHLDLPRYDVIVSFETIEHLPSTQDFLRGVMRTLRPGGLFFVSSPNTDVYKSQSQFHPVMFSQRELEQLLSARFKYRLRFGQHDRRYIIIMASNVPVPEPRTLPESINMLA